MDGFILLTCAAQIWILKKIHMCILDVYFMKINYINMDEPATATTRQDKKKTVVKLYIYENKVEILIL